MKVLECAMLLLLFVAVGPPAPPPAPDPEIELPAIRVPPPSETYSCLRSDLNRWACARLERCECRGPGVDR